MTPEQFFHFDRIHEEVIFEMRVNSLGWLLDCYRSKKIRKQTILNLIQQSQLEEIMEYLLKQERYEQCAIVRDILKEIYNSEYK